MTHELHHLYFFKFQSPRGLRWIHRLSMESPSMDDPYQRSLAESKVAIQRRLAQAEASLDQPLRVEPVLRCAHVLEPCNPRQINTALTEMSRMTSPCCANSARLPLSLCHVRTTAMQSALASATTISEIAWVKSLKSPSIIRTNLLRPSSHQTTFVRCLPTTPPSRCIMTLRVVVVGSASADSRSLHLPA